MNLDDFLEKKCEPSGAHFQENTMGAKGHDANMLIALPVISSHLERWSAVWIDVAIQNGIQAFDCLSWEKLDGLFTLILIKGSQGLPVSR